MRMYTFAANDMRGIQNEVNRLKLTKDQIVNIIQCADKTYMLVYFAE